MLLHLPCNLAIASKILITAMLIVDERLRSEHVMAAHHLLWSKAVEPSDHRQVADAGRVSEFDAAADPHRNIA
eukprot:388119-Rhodomonas_salina.1